jgi:hypothetical protein
MTKGQIYLYGNSTVLRNIDNESLSIIVHGKGLIEKCKVKEINLANQNADVEISHCSDYGTGGAFVTATACKSCVVHDCSILSRNYIVGLTGSPTFLCVRNNIANNIINNGYGTSGGNTYIINNLYKNVFKPSADNAKGIAYESGNIKIV